MAGSADKLVRIDSALHRELLIIKAMTDWPVQAMVADAVRRDLPRLKERAQTEKKAS